MVPLGSLAVLRQANPSREALLGISQTVRSIVDSNKDMCRFHLYLMSLETEDISHSRTADLQSVSSALLANYLTEGKTAI
ncbi:hypothetical protein BGZ54_005187, partial [Gamsiella multidivaricata]